jgi:hypothetical protein
MRCNLVAQELHSCARAGLAFNADGGQVMECNSVTNIGKYAYAT